MFFLPLYHNLQGAKCLVVGGGTTATRKLKWLVRCGAQLQVVSPEITSDIQRWIDEGLLDWQQKSFEDTDLTAHHTLVIGATNNAEINRAIHRAAMRDNVLVNCVDQPELCTVVFPAIVDRFPIVVAISSMGNAPTLSRVVRGWIESRLPANLAVLADLAAQMRDSVKDRLGSVDARKRFWEDLFTGAIAERALTGDGDGALEEATKMLAVRASDQLQGGVALVGAGPGDPELLTLKGLRMLQAADVVLYDKLANPKILDYARRDADMVYVGKEGPKPGRPPRKIKNRSNQQGYINSLIVDYAQQGNFVVRLKGGDPFIYGRGGEELEEIVQAGLDVVVVPGITAAMGAASVAGIPLTYRNVSQSVRFVTGHRVENVINMDWPEMTSTDQTLVIYMGLVGLEQICKNLLAHGCEPERPVAVIENATYSVQRVVTGDLQSIYEKVSQAQVAGPSIVIVGEVVKLATGLRDN
ncbi:MAG: siroheme synthase CysG [Pseudomonadota bacterium]